MFKHDPAICAVQMLGELDAITGLPQQSDQDFPPFGPKLAAEVYAVQLQ